MRLSIAVATALAFAAFLALCIVQRQNPRAVWREVLDEDDPDEVTPLPPELIVSRRYG